MNRTSRFRLLTAFACLAAVMAAGCDAAVEEFALGIASEEPSCNVPEDNVDLAIEVLDLVNEERLRQGMNPVHLSLELSEFGADYACQMIEEGFFGHIHPATNEGFEDRILNSRYRCYSYVGENLARGHTTAEAVFDDWMGSPDHLENILTDEYLEMGLAVRMNSEGHHYWVQLFLGEIAEYSDCEDEFSQSLPGDLSDGLSSTPPLPSTSGDSPTTTTPPPADLPVGATPESGDPTSAESE